VSTKNGTWVDQAAKDLGVEAERQCLACGGKGKISKRPSKSDICRAIIGRQASDKVFARALADPPLSKLQKTAEALGGVSLDAAADWCRKLRERIEAEAS
jgi:hypothetical protein